MALHFMTTDAKDLLAAFDARIAQDEPKGKVTTWQKVVQDNGVFYTHTSAEWARKAYFMPVVKADRLTFNIIKPANKNVSTVAYGYYHGHLTETFLNHFDDRFSNAVSSARPETADVVGSKNSS
jgi:hypothetical protein